MFGELELAVTGVELGEVEVAGGVGFAGAGLPLPSLANGSCCSGIALGVVSDLGGSGAVIVKLEPR